MCGKSATNGLPAFAGCQQVLVRPRPFSDQQHDAFGRKFEPFRQAFRKRLRPVRVAFPVAVLMQRNGLGDSGEHNFARC